ncbi:hypothetical protein JW948_19480 [bacterium]|nr:hypothetical protein [bacterium]
METVKLHWEDIVASVKKKKITVGSFLQEGIPVRLDGDTLEIGFGQSNGFHIDAIMRGKCFVTQAIKEVLNTDLRFRCIKGNFKEDHKTAGPVSKEARKDRLRELSHESDVVRKIVDDFDMEIME